MPKVVIKGKVKHFPYSKKGKEEAKEAAKKSGNMVITGNPLKKRKPKYSQE